MLAFCFAPLAGLAQAKTGGLFSATPDWGVGAQVGNYAGTGLSAQKMGFLGGSLNLAVGIESGTIGLGADYVRYFGNGLHLLDVHSGDAYKQVRGQITPFIGGGLQISNGFGLRVPAGLEYTLRRSPFSFYGGLALYVGPFFSSGGIGPQLWFNLGARVLL